MRRCVMSDLPITGWCHQVIRSQAAAGGMYIDATMGKGRDTLVLCELAGPSGHVTAFDVQEEALEATRTTGQS